MVAWASGLPFTPYQHHVCRLVETQEDAATATLVDDLDEQALLESVLDDFKPPYRAGTEARHYLIATPFRYPPLKHGSRWGGRHERSFFYASEDEATCLAEAAFYRFAFCAGKATPFSEPIRSEHCLFYVAVESQLATDLTLVDDENIQQQLVDPVNYAYTQSVGTAVRKGGAEMIRYFSARYLDGINVAVDNPEVIVSAQPFNKTMLTCEIDSDQSIVRFRKTRDFPISYAKEMFLVNGLFPALA